VRDKERFRLVGNCVDAWVWLSFEVNSKFYQWSIRKINNFVFQLVMSTTLKVFKLKIFETFSYRRNLESLIKFQSPFIYTCIYQTIRYINALPILVVFQLQFFVYRSHILLVAQTWKRRFNHNSIHPLVVEIFSEKRRTLELLKEQFHDTWRLIISLLSFSTQSISICAHPKTFSCDVFSPFTLQRDNWAAQQRRKSQSALRQKPTRSWTAS